MEPIREIEVLKKFGYEFFKEHLQGIGNLIGDSEFSHADAEYYRLVFREGYLDAIQAYKSNDPKLSIHESEIYHLLDTKGRDRVQVDIEIEKEKLLKQVSDDIDRLSHKWDGLLSFCEVIGSYDIRKTENKL
ncbi:MAG: hypothetical protein GY718_09955 [Lentisphaerae bacterium]|nr:hypothetical protein [Lentisphaerota bacterium]